MTSKSALEDDGIDGFLEMGGVTGGGCLVRKAGRLTVNILVTNASHLFIGRGESSHLPLTGEEAIYECLLSLFLKWR